MGAANCAAVLLSVPINNHSHDCTALLDLFVVVSGAIVNTWLYLTFTFITTWTDVCPTSWSCRSTTRQCRRCARWLVRFSVVTTRWKNKLSSYSRQSHNSSRLDMSSNVHTSTDITSSRLDTRNLSLSACRYWRLIFTFTLPYVTLPNLASHYLPSHYLSYLTYLQWC